jgi:hypothetical protein
MRKLLEAARRKWGPLPVWAWAAIAGTIGALYWRMRGGDAADTGAAIQGPAFAYGGEPDYGDTGGTPAGGGAAGVDGGTGVGMQGAAYDIEGNFAKGELEGFAKRLESIEWGMANVGEHLNDPGYWGVDTGADGSGTAPESGVGAGGTETVTPDKPDDVDRSKPKPKAGGVSWGGRTFTTKQGLGSWLSSRGASYSTWAKRHPAAAKLLKGPVPKPKPAPRKPAPRPASGRAPARQAPKTGRGQAGARPRTPPKPKPVAKRKPPRPSVRPQTKTPVGGKKKKR